MATLLLGMVGTVTAVDDFEDGDTDEYENNGGFISADTSQVNYGTYSGKFNGTASLIFSTSGLPSYPSQGDSFSQNVYIESSSSRAGIVFGVQDSDNFYMVRHQSFDSNAIQLFVKENGGFTELESTSASNYNTGEWLNYTVDWASDGTITFTVKDSAGNQVGQVSATDNTFTSGGYGYRSSDSIIYYDAPKQNSPPSIDSVVTEPESWTLDSSINVSADVSDDGTVSSVSADVWENGTKIVSDASLSDSDGDGTWNISDLFLVDESDVYYNYTLTATDDDGATSTYEDSQLIENLEPKVTHLKPDNNTYFSYDKNYKIRIQDDGDNVLEEEITCDLYNNTQQFRTVSAFENDTQEDRTFSGNLKADIGFNEFRTKCVDGDTDNKSTYYTTERLNISESSTSSPVYETENVSYNIDLTAGDMIEEVKTYLYWNDTRENTENSSNSGITDHSFTHNWRPYLVENNDTEFSWKIQVEAEYQEFNSTNTSTLYRNTSSENQTIYQAYHSPEISNSEDKLIELEEFDSTLSFTNHLSSEVANITGYLTFNGTEKQSRNPEFEFPLVGPGKNKSNKTVTGRIELEFKDRTDTRNSVDDDWIVGHKKILTDCSSGSASQDNSIKFTLYNEENRSEKVNGEIDFNFDTTHHGEHERNYAFGRTGKEAETCIYPSWATYRITGPISYTADNYTDRAYNFYNVSINNDVDQTNLYLLPNEFSTPVYYRVKNRDGTRIQGATVKTMRYFVDKDSYLTISKVETDSEGQSQTYQRVNDIYYKYIISKDGETLLVTENQILACTDSPCTKEFTVDPGSVSEYFETKQGFTYDCFLNQDEPSLQCTVDHETDSMEKARLQVEEQQKIGKKTQCDIEVVQTGSSMVCQLGNLSQHKYEYHLTAWKDDDKFELDYGVIDQTGGIFDDDANALFIGLFLVLSSAGLGNYSPGAGIMWTCIGLTTVYFTGIFSIGVTALTGILAIGAIAFLEVKY